MKTQTAAVKITTDSRKSTLGGRSTSFDQAGSATARLGRGASATLPALHGPSPFPRARHAALPRLTPRPHGPCLAQCPAPRLSILPQISASDRRFEEVSTNVCFGLFAISAGLMLAACVTQLQALTVNWGSFVSAWARVLPL